MEEMASLWYYQETIDEMRQKLMYTNLELENLKVEKNEEMRKNKEYVKQLIQLLNMVCQERDEAKDQLQKLLNKLSHVQVDNSPHLKDKKANSSITQSNSFSETHNNQSHNSSPIDAFNDAVSSPEFSNNNMADSNTVAYDCNVRFLDNCVPQLVPKVDEATLVIDNLVKGKTLPQKGKLLKSVIEAGPLLHTLLVSGQLPQWRNPPQLKSFNAPPVLIKGSEAEIATQSFYTTLSYPVSRSLYSQMSYGSPQILSTSTLNFANSGSVSCLENQRGISVGANTDSFVHLDKRQRLR
ncbi:uncharacterized protein LOC107764570 [Nicotiana tabacum]|uniref:Uncharacterized protein LOC107764570 n=1 Tax=Nicotiana tabacum TaxID=4097 RepID=A0A1S3XFK5_TOBAC|nr:uncharacterized protein LOC104108026 [Nicotiana tomentosiformis]XP_016438650.1 PREDICTED: uncharacterized protein LOC107764570 [Nicotiana tabacum]